MGNPHLYHHLNYLDISFQVKMKSEKGPEKHILWETRAAAAQDRRWLDRPWNCVTVAYQGNQPKQKKLCPIMLSTVWRSCRYANGHSTQILLRPKYPSGLISVARCSKAVENRSTLTFIQAWHFRGLILAYILLPNMLWIQNRAIERVLTSDL